MVYNELRLALYKESLHELKHKYFDEFMKIFSGKMIANGFLDDLCTLNEQEKKE